MKKVMFVIMVLLLSKTVYAAGGDAKYDLGQVVVTATKTEQYQDEVGSFIDVITAGQIDDTKENTVLEVLRKVPGVAVAQNSGFGGMASVYLRGANSNHTLVLVDGIELNDPMSAGRSFNFAHLTTANIERIEVIRGAQSTLYGSDAIGGVINIITKKGKGTPKFEFSSEAGSYDTYKEDFSLSGALKKMDYSLSLSNMDSEGISKAVDGAEDDAYSNTTVSSKIGVNLFDNSKLSAVIRYTNTETDLDDGAYNDDPNYVAWWDNLSAKIVIEQIIKNWWDYSISVSYNDVRRKGRDEKDSTDVNDNMAYWYKGDNRKIELQNNFIVSGIDTITAGFEYEQDRGSSLYRSGAFLSKFDRRSVRNRAYYLQNYLKLWDFLSVTAGLRVDDHQLFGTETNAKLSTAYIIEKTKTCLKANWGTGFKAPSLYQLYSTEDYGNGPIGDPNLSPDESKSYDIGIKQNLFNNKISLGINYFNNQFEHLVDYDLTNSRYRNIDDAETKGMETEIKLDLMDNIDLSANYTYTRTKDENSGKELTRRPKKQIGAVLNYKYLDKGNVNIAITYAGHRWMNNANTTKSKPYTTVDLALSYNIRDNISIFGKAENIFDRTYQEIEGYAAQKASFYGGAKIEF